MNKTVNKEEKKKEKYYYPILSPPVGIFTGLKDLGLKGKKLWIATFLIIITTMLVAFLLAIYF